MVRGVVPSSSMGAAYLGGLLLGLCLNLVWGQSADGEVSCIAKHASNWGDKMGELRIDISQCDKGYIEWTWPKGHLKVIFEDESRQDFSVCIEQMDLSPWTAIRNMTHEVDNRIEPLKLPIGKPYTHYVDNLPLKLLIGRPTCTAATNGRLRICIEKPLLRVYRTSLYFDINRR